MQAGPHLPQRGRKERCEMDYKNVIDAIGIYEDAEEFELALESAKRGADFTCDIDGSEYRFIHEDAIERIHRQEIEELVNDCYLGGKEIPDVVRRYFDYDSFARDCRISDGYGHHFASYDGEELEADGWYIFRVG